MRQVRTEIEIEATPERVWQVLTNWPEWSAWNPLLHRAEGRLGMSETVEIAFQGPGEKEVCTQCTVVELEPGHTWTWTYSVVAPLLFRGEHTFAVEPDGPGRTRFAHCETFRGLLVPFFVDEAKTEADFEAMDRALEKRTGPSAR